MVVLSKNKWYFRWLVGIEKALRYKRWFHGSLGPRARTGIRAGNACWRRSWATVIPCLVPAWFVTASETGYRMFALL